MKSVTTIAFLLILCLPQTTMAQEGQSYAVLIGGLGGSADYTDTQPSGGQRPASEPAAPQPGPDDGFEDYIPF